MAEIECAWGKSSSGAVVNRLNGEAVQVLSLARVRVSESDNFISLALIRKLQELPQIILEKLTTRTAYCPRVFTMDRYTEDTKPDMAVEIGEIVGNSTVIVAPVGRLDYRVRRLLGNDADFLVCVPK